MARSIPSDVLAGQPDILFEDTTTDFRHSPLQIKRKGCLHSSWAQFSLAVYILEAAEEGFYHKTHLERTPHCQTLKSQRRVIQQLCVHRKIPCRILRSVRNHSLPGINAVNHGTREFNTLNHNGVLHSILDTRLLVVLLESLKIDGQSDRGSGQLAAGYASLNIKFDEDHIVTCPQILSSTTPELVQKMVDMTSVVKQFCPLRGIASPYQGDAQRTAEWAQRLCDTFNVGGDNIFEQVTFAVTCLEHEGGPVLFGAHVDDRNDSTWSDVFCYYRHILHGNKLYRLAMICYSRAVIRHYLYRADAYIHLKARITAYIQSPTNRDRHRLSISACLPIDAAKWIVSDGIAYRHSLPFFDKGGFYLGFVDALEKVCYGQTLERYCELAIVAGWISSAVNFQKILNDFCKQNTLRSTDTETWTTRYIDQAIKKYNGVTNGVGARTQPWFNFSVKYGELIDGLKILRTAILRSNNELYSYAKLHKSLCRIVGVGHLGAQHLIGVLSLGGLIQPRYQDIATICGQTTTFKKIQKDYGLSLSVAEKLKSTLAIELSLSEKNVEAATCEMFRESDQMDMDFDIKKHAKQLKKRSRYLKYPDTFFQGQSIYVIEGNKRYLLKLVEGGEDMKVYLPFTPPVSSCTVTADDWWGPLLMAKAVYHKEVQTSRNSSFNHGNKQKKVSVRKPVTHSGFGVHAGLEDLLSERDLLKSGNLLRKGNLQEDYDSDADDAANAYIPPYMRPVQRYTILQTRGLRSLRGNRSMFHTMDMILQANSEDGTYSTIDLDREVFQIINGHQPCRTSIRWKRKLWRQSITTELSPTRSTFSYSASMMGGEHRKTGGIKASLPDDNCFWEPGYVGTTDGMTYYSTWDNARRATAIRILVDLGCHLSNDQPGWASKVMSKVRGGNTFCVLYENMGRRRDTACLLFVLRQQPKGLVMYVPSQNLGKPWYEIAVTASSFWDGKRKRID